MTKVICMRVLTAWAVAYIAVAFIKADGGWIFDLFDWSGYERFILLYGMIAVAFPVLVFPKDSREWLFKHT